MQKTNSHKYAVLGSSGQLGRSFKALENSCLGSVQYFTRKALDITSNADVMAFFNENSFDVVINCAAYTDVERAEDESHQAHVVNADAVSNLCEAASRFNFFLVHFSTDYVFNGQQRSPYLETDQVDPINVYGLSKWKGEEALMQSDCAGVVFRVSWLYSPFEKNFLKTMIHLGSDKEYLKVVDDQWGCPTNALILAADVLKFCAQRSLGELLKLKEILHYGHHGITTWFGFANAIFKSTDIIVEIEAVDSAAFPTKAIRPKYSKLNTTKLQSMGITLCSWEEALSDCLNYMKENEK